MDMAAKVAACATKARRNLVMHRPHRRRGQRGHGRRGGAGEALPGGRRRRHLPGGAGHDAEMFREFARRVPDAPLLANMTEFGRYAVLHRQRVRGDGL